MIEPDIKATLEAADQVACEFKRADRVDLLAQAVRTEHARIGDNESRAIAICFVDGQE